MAVSCLALAEARGALAERVAPRSSQRPVWTIGAMTPHVGSIIGTVRWLVHASQSDTGVRETEPLPLLC